MQDTQRLIIKIGVKDKLQAYNEYLFALNFVDESIQMTQLEATNLF